MPFFIFRNLRQTSRLSSCIGKGSKGRYVSSNVDNSQTEDVIIPQYIPRSPTDILEALATTIRRDPTAPHFKYHDDPFLYPMSNYKKRVYALAQESGRKAAHWVRQEHPDLFKYTVSDPPEQRRTLYINAEPQIEAYIPRTVYDDQSQVSEEDLKIVIKNRFVTDAITVYKLLESKNPGAISAETQQQLLELLCFFNEDDPIPEEWIEEKWFNQGNGLINDRRNKWKENGIAMSIFTNMEEKTPEAYCAIIQGMCKHYQAESAYALYEECIQAGIPLNTGVFNGILSIVGFLKDNFDLKWQLTKEIMATMNSLDLSPNLGTLNAILESLSLESAKQCKDCCMQILAELGTTCKIEPSLASWHYILTIFHKEKNSNVNVLHTILDKLEGQSLTVRDPKDVFFFSSAMVICRNLQDLNLGRRLHNLLLQGNNYDLIGDSYKESGYYRTYFNLFVRSAPLETFMETYNELVPHVYTPEYSVMEEILHAIDINGALDYYPIIWSHLVLFELTSRQSTIQFLIESMVRNLPELKKEASPENPITEDKKDAKVNDNMESLSSLTVEENFAKIALEIFNKIQENVANNRQKLRWTGSMLSDILMLLVRGGKFDESLQVVDLLTNSGPSIGVPFSPDALTHFAREAVKNGKPSYSATALTYLSQCGFTESEDVSLEIIQKILNRPESEVKELAHQAALRNSNAYDSDPTLEKLLCIVNQKNQFNPSHGRKAQSSSSDSSDTSDSDSSDDESEHLKK